MARLTDKAALITGAGAGIGAACAKLFCAEGAAVTLVDANKEALDRIERSIRTAYPDAKLATFVADVADAGLALHAVEHGIKAYGGLDILVNNAAMRNYLPVAETTPSDWQAMVGVNLVGVVNYCRAALPSLRQSGAGSIVNVSSCYAVTGRKNMGIYDATKAGQIALTRTLAHEEAMYGVRANVVCPGSTLTDFHVAKAEASGKSIDRLKTERQSTSLLGRWAEPDEIAWPVLWLASSESSFMTGATVMVDGGLSIM